jgi:hypothetical protein
MRVIRVHHKNNIYRGAYRGNGCAYDYYPTAEQSANRHPCPRDEGHQMEYDHDFCGFTDMTQMHQWFDHAEARANMFKVRQDYVVSEFETEDPNIYPAQVIFRLKEATLVRTLEPHEYL